MKALIFWALSLLMIAAPASAQVIKDDNPYRLLEQVAEKTFARIAEERDRINDDPNYLKTVVREELMPYVDNIYASKKVLGRYFKDTSSEQRQAFYQAFTDYIVATYARAFTQYDESKHDVEFVNPKNVSPDDRAVRVETRVIEQGRPPIRLDFAVRYDSESETWKAYDLIVEGVSLLQSKQSEISSVIRARGIDNTIALLKDKAEQPISLDDEVDVPA
ncbi:phospholipid-binding protein MlaC [Idiomarina sp. OT37-5b]|jgi:phospholipid transport system substrate-binding protein|uniref:Phospholipid-binding protein MlaC n=1 Tax=Idiomarina aquatica TaxID=1327752 RepID=A0AA94EGE3_9GAMM|nr:MULTISPECIES: phospholipid-binding protein MlaC [Idiomarina]AVJ55101.1 phospholipid-binding protein MlaC [Idiomarina sp. OT37-5b]RUO45367.1 phospholipid-binding protein MlaC [Idiomarina aquatica]